MSKKILLAALGTSPAVITEAIDLLDKDGLRPDGVWIFTTKDSDVQKAFKLLMAHLPYHCNLSWIQEFRIGTFGDIDTSEAAVEFMKEACAVLKNCRDVGYRCYVCIAGGRKAMSALLTLAVQFYGAERLFHIWVPPWIEEQGEINELEKWRDIPEELNKRLHPPLDVADYERPRLVQLPFLGLFPMLPEVQSALSEGASEVAKPVRELLKANGLLDSEGKPTGLGRMVGEILDEVESLPPPCPNPVKIHLNQSEPKFKAFLEEYSRRLSTSFPFICEIRDITWREGEEKVVASPLDILRIYFRPPGKSFNVGLELRTTAQTSGQLEAARRAVERFLS